MLRRLQTPGGSYFGAGIRVALGLSLLLSASSSRAPQVLLVLGIVFLVAGIAMPFLGLEVFSSALESFMGLGPWAARVWGGVALGSGLLIAYLVAPWARGA